MMHVSSSDVGAQGLAARSPHAAEAPARVRCLDVAARCRWRVNVLAAALMFLGLTRAPTAGGIQPLFGGSLTWRVDRHFNNASGEGRRVTLTLWTAFAASQACVYETGRAPRCGDSPECGTACSVAQRFVALSGRVKSGMCTYWSQTGMGFCAWCRRWPMVRKLRRPAPSRLPTTSLSRMYTTATTPRHSFASLEGPVSWWAGWSEKSRYSCCQCTLAKCCQVVTKRWTCRLQKKGSPCLHGWRLTTETCHQDSRVPQCCCGNAVPCRSLDS